MEEGYTPFNVYTDFDMGPVASFPRGSGGSAARFVTAPPAPVYSQHSSAPVHSAYSPALQAITQESLGPAASYPASSLGFSGGPAAAPYSPGPATSFLRGSGGSAARFTPSTASSLAGPAAAPSLPGPAVSFPRVSGGSIQYLPGVDASYPRDLGGSAARFTPSTASSLAGPAVATPIGAKTPPTVYIHPQPAITNAYRTQPVHPVPPNTGGAAVVARVPTPSVPVVLAVPKVASTPAVVPLGVNASQALDNQVLTTLLLKTMTGNKLLVGRVSTLEEKLEECMVRLAKFERVPDQVAWNINMMADRLGAHEEQRNVLERINQLRSGAFADLSKKVDLLEKRVEGDIDRLDDLLAKNVNCHPGAPAPSVVQGPAPALDAVLVDTIVPAPTPAPTPDPALASAPTPAPALASALAPTPAPTPAPAVVLAPAAAAVPIATVPSPAVAAVPIATVPSPAVAAAPIATVPSQAAAAAVTVAKIDVLSGEVLCDWLEKHVQEDDRIRIISELEKALSESHVVIFGKDIQPEHLCEGMGYLAFPQYSYKPDVRELCMKGKAAWDESCFEMGTTVFNYQQTRKDSVPLVTGKPDTPFDIWKLLLAVFLLSDYAVCKEILALVEIK